MIIILYPTECIISPITTYFIIVAWFSLCSYYVVNYYFMAVNTYGIDF